MCTQMYTLTFINNVVFFQYVVSEEIKALANRQVRFLFMLMCGTQA